MAVAVDTYDKPNGVHPRYKQIVGERLAIAGLSVGYGIDSFPSQGPVATDVQVLATGDYQLTYDQAFTYDDSELTGFFSCCGAPGSCRDQDGVSAWPAVAKDKVSANPSSLTVTI